MDTHVKEGQLYVQHQKFGKKWKKSWFVLYPASQNGIARLEFFEGSAPPAGGSASSAGDKPISTKKLDKKIIRLSECISILPAVTEACPKDGMAAFCVETNDKTHVFAAERQACAEWVDKMCEIAFQGGSGSASLPPDSNGQKLPTLQMAENLIYYSRDEVSEFWVCVQRTEASERCGLLGTYWLKADGESLVLRESRSRRSLLVWPYKLLRRYGRDRVMFSFEAGRRCESGPGNFTFETKQGNELFLIVENAIRAQKSQTDERHLSSGPPPTFDPDGLSSSAPGRGTTAGSVTDGDADSGGSKPGSADGVFGGKGPTHKGRSLPEPPPMAGVMMAGGGGGGTPPRSPLARGGGGGKGGGASEQEQGGLYSEPADAIRPPPSGDALYSSPADTIAASSSSCAARPRPLGDEGGGRLHGDKASPAGAEPLYSDLYDRISLDLIQRIGGLDGGGGGGGGGGGVGGRRQAEGAPPAEHIYDEPEGRAGASPLPPEPALYDEARPLEPHGWRGRGQEEAGPQGLYDLAGAEYSVPPGHAYPFSHPQTQTQTQPPFRAPPAPRRHKPPTASKPAPKPGPPRKEPMPPPRTGGGNANNNNCGSVWAGPKPGGVGGGVGGQTELYSKVSKHQHPPAPGPWGVPAMRAPDIIYDNLGDI